MVRCSRRRAPGPRGPEGLRAPAGLQRPRRLPASSTTRWEGALSTTTLAQAALAACRRPSVSDRGPSPASMRARGSRVRRPRGERPLHPRSRTNQAAPRQSALGIPAGDPRPGGQYRGQKKILKGLSLTVKPGHNPRPHGAERQGQETLAYTLMGHPGYQVPGHWAARPGTRPEAAGMRPTSAPGWACSWPSSTQCHPRRDCGELPAHGDQRASPKPRRGATGDQVDRHPGRSVPQGAGGEDGAPENGPGLCPPLPQRGLHRRREEADRDSADGDAQAEHGDHGRDRLAGWTSTRCATWPTASTPPCTPRWACW